MASSLTSVGFQALQAGNSVKNFVQDIGSSPQNEDGTIKGEGSDGIHNKVKPSIMDIMGIAGSKSVSQLGACRNAISIDMFEVYNTGVVQ
jgi:hypothetical protein